MDVVFSMLSKAGESNMLISKRRNQNFRKKSYRMETFITQLHVQELFVQNIAFHKSKVVCRQKILKFQNHVKNRETEDRSLGSTTYTMGE